MPTCLINYFASDELIYLMVGIMVGFGLQCVSSCCYPCKDEPFMHGKIQKGYLCSSILEFRAFKCTF